MFKITMHKNGKGFDSYYRFVCPLCVNRHMENCDIQFLQQEATRHLTADHKAGPVVIHFDIAQVELCEEQFVINGSVAKCELERGYIRHWHEATVDGVQIKWMTP